MLSVKNLSVGYSNEKTTLDDISFSVNPGEIICIMGESGSGKSTLLKSLYGLLDLLKGEINWHDDRITGPKNNLVPGYEHFKYVPQDFDLMPHITVAESVGKHLPRFDMTSHQDTIDSMLDIVGLSSYASTKIKYLSGGQKQRVALAKATATEPKLLLLDEPFGQIDIYKRNELSRSLFGSLKHQNITCILATHDGNDALSFADKVLILKDGKLINYTDPKKLYKNPKDYYSASLFNDVNQLTFGDKEYLIFSSQLQIAEKSNFTAEVVNSYFKGSHWLIECEYNKKLIFINHYNQLDEGETINFKLKGMFN